MHGRNTIRPGATVAALDAFVTAYERRQGVRLNLTTLARDMHQLRDALETAIGANDPDLYSAAERLVRTIHIAPLPPAA